MWLTVDVATTVALILMVPPAVVPPAMAMSIPQASVAGCHPLDPSVVVDPHPKLARPSLHLAIGCPLLILLVPMVLRLSATLAVLAIPLGAGIRIAANLAVEVPNLTLPPAVLLTLASPPTTIPHLVT